jgi:hypothetical protein
MRADTEKGDEWLLVSLKALGDFLIAYRSLQTARAPATMRILAAEHLRDFIDALQAQSRVRILASGPHYPSAWDIKRQGILAGLRNLSMLRKQFETLSDESQLLFDQWGWRERVLGWRHRCTTLLPAANVYQAFAQTLAQLGLQSDGQIKEAARPGAGRVRIYPASRIAAKTLSGPVLARLVQQVAACGLNCEVVALGDEALDLPSELPVQRIERSFTALIESIRSSLLVISADSLPGHLADYFGLPVHIVSPQANQYWLPLSCFLDGSWSIFEDTRSLPSWLSRVVGR